MFRWILCIYLCATTLLAQITLDSTDYGATDSTLFYYRSRDLTTWTPGPGGTSQSWDFSSLTHSSQNIYSFVQPQGTEHILEFPEAKFAYEFVSQAYAYVQNTPEGLLQLGLGGNAQEAFGLPISFSVRYGQPMNELPLPATYGTPQATFAQRVVADAKEEANYLFIDSVRVRRKVYRGQTIDGWGTLHLPGGRSLPVLRIARADTTIDSIWVRELGQWRNGSQFLSIIPKANFDTTRTYLFFAKGQHNYLMRIALDNDDSVRTLEYMVDIAPLGRTSTPTTNRPHLWPQPATHTVQLQWQQPDSWHSLQLLDAQGRTLRTLQLQGTGCILDVSGLSTGLYHYHMQRPGGTTSGRIIVVHP